MNILQIAAEHGKHQHVEKIVEYAREFGIDGDKENIDEKILNIINDCGDEEYENYSALHYAAKAGNYDLITLLLGLGADPNLKNKNDETPLHAATRYDK